MTDERGIRVLFSCSGVGIFNRGIETFFREAFDGLRQLPGIETQLLKGAGAPAPGEMVVHCLPRTQRLASWIGRCTGRSAYAVEQWTSFPSVVRQIRRWRPHVVFYSDANLGFLLYRFRRRIGVPFRLLFSNGGPCDPPFHRRDFIQQVAPLYLEEALRAGEPPERHFLVPYGIHVPAAPTPDPERRRALRTRLGLPQDRPVVLSVGWIARQHKRMDYVIEEVARLPQPRPFLQLLGAMDAQSAELVELGRQRLGVENFAAASVPYERVADYYRAADVFVLASLKEGFGRVYLEALMHGLPSIGHRHPVIEYVLGDAGIVTDLSVTGGLVSVLIDTLSGLRGPDHRYTLPASGQRRWESVRERFSWEVLRPQYAGMFREAAGREIRCQVYNGESR